MLKKLAILILLLLLSRSSFAETQAHTKEKPIEILVKGVPFNDPLINVPQSASVSLASELEEREVVSIQDTIEKVPGITFSGGTSRPRFFIIRGVGELEQYEGAPNPSVATIIDDIDFSGLGVPLPLFDIERVEVLRGPQGINFGANALAGVVNIRSIDPSSTPHGWVKFTGGNDELLSGGAAYNTPIAGTMEKLQLRVSAFRLTQNGFRDNLFRNEEDTNKRDEEFFRAKLRFLASDTTTIDLTTWLSQANNGYDVFAIDNSLTTQSDDPGKDALETKAGALKISTEVSKDIRLESITTVMNAKQDYSFDGDWGNNPFWAPHDPYDFFSDSDRERSVYSQELRLKSADKNYTHGESYRWLLGIFGQELNEDTQTSEFSDDIQYDFLDSNYDATTGAIFSQVEIPIATDTAFTPGIRIEQRNADYSDSRGSELSPNDTMLGGQAALTHDLNNSTRIYFNLSKGFKAGGVNPGPSVAEDRRIYNPEFLWNYELGVKGSWFDDLLRSSIAVFYQSREDQQLKFAVQDDPEDPLAFTYITESSAEGESFGVEFETIIKPHAQLELFLNSSISDSQFTAAPDESAALNGRQFSHAPQWQYTTGAKVLLTEALHARVEVTGQDSFYFDDSHNQRSQPYHLVNTALSYDFESTRISLWAKNLFDENYTTRGFFFGNEPPDFPNTLYTQRGDPRTFGVSLIHRF
ncbi:MAG: TonB-dependent receptor [Bdellovibrionota bacterium]